MRRSNHFGKISGFTLIEMMIVVVIIGILAAVAYPSYQQQVIKSRRTDIQRVMVEYAQAMERYYTSNGKYVSADDSCGLAKPNATAGYTLDVACTATTFNITAAPASGGSQVGDGDQKLDQSGSKTGKWKS